MDALDTDSVGEEIELSEVGIAKPTLTNPDPTTEQSVQPLIADLVRGQFTWGEASFTTLGGETVTQDGPPRAGRLTLEGLVGQSQLQDLFALMRNTQQVEFVSEPFTQIVAPDTFEIEQQAKHSETTYLYEGDRVREALYTFSLQQKERGETTLGQTLDG